VPAFIQIALINATGPARAELIGEPDALGGLLPASEPGHGAAGGRGRFLAANAGK
jgi:hypothetical protein